MELERLELDDFVVGNFFLVEWILNDQLIDFLPSFCPNDNHSTVSWNLRPGYKYNASPQQIASSSKAENFAGIRQEGLLLSNPPEGKTDGKTRRTIVQLHRLR
jgi:hypothetical protein